MALTDNLNAYWKLDESSGNASDSSGNGNTLTATSIRGYVAGKINNGVDFEASSSDSMQASDSASLSIAGDMTASLWANFESFPSGLEQAGFFQKGDTLNANVSYRFVWDAEQSYIKFDFYDTGTQTEGHFPSSDIPSTGTWYHIVVTVDVSASTIAVYVNNSSKTITYSIQTATSMRDDTGVFTLGANRNTTNFGFFDGIIDEVGLWSRILTSDEITALYNSGNGLQYPFGTTAANSSFLMFMA